MQIRRRIHYGIPRGSLAIGAGWQRSRRTGGRSTTSCRPTASEVSAFGRQLDNRGTPILPRSTGVLRDCPPLAICSGRHLRRGGFHDRLRGSERASATPARRSRWMARDHRRLSAGDRLVPSGRAAAQDMSHATDSTPPPHTSQRLSIGTFRRCNSLSIEITQDGVRLRARQGPMPSAAPPWGGRPAAC